MDLDRLKKQLEFVLEIDKLKTVRRQTLLTDRSRQENSSEHSWHLALLAMVLSEYAKEKIDLLQVLKIVLVHDLVEIDAGDTYCYDDDRLEDQKEREIKAADRIFNLLPSDQAEEFRGLWEEYEAQKTPESLFAAALDRLQPVMNNYHTQGETWKKNGIQLHQVIARNQKMGEGAPELWEQAKGLIDDAVAKGWILS